MKYLAWYTSSKAGAIVAFETFVDAPLSLLSEMTLNVDATHSEKLLWAIHQMLEASRWKLSELDGLGVGVGPGSFTGLRIGLTTARTLADTLKKTVMPVSSLAALLKPAALLYSHFPVSTYVIASTDACKGELFSLWGTAQEVLDYCSFLPDFSPSHPEFLGEQVTSPQVLIEQIQTRLQAQPDSQWIAVGEGRARYLDIWQQLPKEREVSQPFLLSSVVQPRFLAQMVEEGFKKQLNCDPLQVFPQYIRAPDAELKLAQKKA